MPLINNFFCSCLFQAFPFAFCLMTKKSQAAYEHLFNYIDENIFKLSSVASFTTDYEDALRNGLAKTNPNARMYACHFHYCQALKRRATQINGFVNFIRTNKEAESIYYRLMALPLLPADFILEAFDQLQQEALKVNKKNFKQFFAYYKRQWIRKVNKYYLISLPQSNTFTSFVKLFKFYFIFVQNYINSRRGYTKFLLTEQKCAQHPQLKHIIMY